MEKKGVIPYEIYRDVGAVIKAVVASAEELGIKEYVPLPIDYLALPPGGVSVYESGDRLVFDPTLFNFRIACHCEWARIYSAASMTERAMPTTRQTCTRRWSKRGWGG